MAALPPAPDNQHTHEDPNTGSTFHVLLYRTKGVAVVTGQLKPAPVEGEHVMWVAACPPEIRASVMGSGLPFASHDQAFENTPNTGWAMTGPHGEVRIELQIPGAYYTGLGTVLIPPTLFIHYKEAGTSNDAQKSQQHLVHVPIDLPVAFRLNTYPMQFTAPRSSPNFYTVSPEPLARSQEAILRASAYPSDNVMPENFWGTKPPR